MTKKGKNGKPKFKAMKEVKAEHAQQVTKAEKPNEPDPMLEKALAALRKLGGKATSTELVKELGFEGEMARDKARRLMDKLIDEHKVKREKSEERKGQYLYHLVEHAHVEKPPEVAAQ